MHNFTLGHQEYFFYIQLELFYSCNVLNHYKSLKNDQL